MKFYRYEAIEYASTDMDGEYVTPLYPNPKLELRDYDLIKETPKGYWIGYLNPFGVRMGDWQKWVSKTSKKKFAYLTKEEALINFIKRTERRISILDRQLSACRVSLNTAKSKEHEIQSVKN
jgi:hypothetical protein